MQLFKKSAELERLGDYPRAVLFYQASINACLVNAVPYVSLLALLLRIGEKDNALKVIQMVPEALYKKTDKIRFLHALVLIEKERAAEALPLLNALTMSSDVDAGVVHNNLGACYSGLHLYDEALLHFSEARKRNVSSVEMFINLASVYLNTGRMQDAEDIYRQGLDAHPDSDDIRCELAICLLKRGGYEEGFDCYTSRWRSRLHDMDIRSFPVPEWTPDCEAKSLAIFYEQGVGDQVVFSCMLPWFLERLDTVVVYCDSRLARLVERSFPGVTCRDIEGGDDTEQLEKLDAYLMAADMGRYAYHLAGQRRAFFQADSQRVEGLRRKYREMFPGRMIVGISWRSKRDSGGIAKSLEIEDLGEILRQTNVQFINFQYGDIEEDIRKARDLFGVDIYCDPEVDSLNDLDGLAAQALAFDLLVSSSNSQAHLAAAVGAETWLATPFGRGLLWYWGCSGDRVRWYPSVRLFRARGPKSWDDVVRGIGAQLKEILESKYEKRGE